MVRASDTTQLQVRRATPDDLGDLLAFYRTHHAHRSRLTDPGLIAWLFVKQPASQEGLPLFLLECNGQIEGAIGYVSLRVSIKSSTYPARFPVAFFINDRFRGLPALMLFRALLADADLLLASYISADARKLAAKSGFKDIGSGLTTYYHPTRFPTEGARSRLLFLARSAALSARRLITAVIAPKLRYECTAVPSEAFLTQCLDWRPIARISKTLPWFRWRYVDSPALKPVFVHQYNGKHPSGLAVVHISREKNEAVILDLFWKTDDPLHLTSLIDRILVEARKLGNSLVVCHSTSRLMRDTFRRSLFGSSASDLGLVISSADPQLLGALLDTDAWLFMTGDTDAY